MALSPHLETLLGDLRALHFHLRKQTYEKFNRINPFYEDLFSWKERGAFWVNEEIGITIYNSTTVVGDVDIGENTWIGPFCSLDGTGGLKIGSNCSISLGCQLVSHDTIKWALSGGKAPYDYAPIIVGNCCFLGAHAIITKGVTIGDHCLIAAGSVVAKDVPPFSIIGGVPGRIIGRVKVSNIDDMVHLEYDGCP